MSVTPSSAIVGVFGDQAAAEQAMDAFYNAGFTHEQVRKSVPETSGGFFGELKSLFTGANTSGGDVTSDLTGMGISDEEAQYYAHEHSNGNTILAVHAPGREQEAQTIMQQYGAYSAYARTNSSTQSTTSATPASDIQQDTTPTNTPVQPHNTDTVTTQDTQDTQTQPQSVEEQSYQDARQSVNFVLVPNADQTEQAPQTYTDHAGSDPYHPQVSTPEHDTVAHTEQPVTDEEDTETHVAHTVTSDDISTKPHDAQPVTTDYNMQNQTS